MADPAQQRGGHLPINSKEGRMLKVIFWAMLVAILPAILPAYADDVVITEYKSDPSGAPFAVGIAKGLFKDAGPITGVVSGGGGGSSVHDLVASKLGFGEVTPSAAIAAIQNGQDLKMVNLGTRNLGLSYIVVMPNSPIKTLKDVKGKKWGISRARSLGEMIAVMAVQKAGLKPGDVQRVALGSLGGAITALEHGAVDVTDLPANLFATLHGAQKYRVIAGPNDLPQMSSEVGLATGDLIRNHPDRLRAILAAREKAVQYIYQHPEESAKILAKVYAPMTEHDVADMVKKLIEVKFWTNGAMEMAPLENDVSAMKAVGLLTGNVDLKAMIDTSFLPADVKH
jgi:NitT/TauT family transport system substrate-binding protein